MNPVPKPNDDFLSPDDRPLPNDEFDPLQDADDIPKPIDNFSDTSDRPLPED
ncbi:MAG: hypothetical protein ACKVH8_03420 [Pirellulales bacterium]